MDPEGDRFTNPIRGNPTADPTRGPLRNCWRGGTEQNVCVLSAVSHCVW